MARICIYRRTKPDAVSARPRSAHKGVYVLINVPVCTFCLHANGRLLGFREVARTSFQRNPARSFAASCCKVNTYYLYDRPVIVAQAAVISGLISATIRIFALCIFTDTYSIGKDARRRIRLIAPSLTRARLLPATISLYMRYNRNERDCEKHLGHLPRRRSFPRLKM